MDVARMEWMRVGAVWGRHDQSLNRRGSPSDLVLAS